MQKISDVAAKPRFSARRIGAEYRHSDFSNQNVLLGFGVTGAPISTNVRYTTDQATVRGNWHFDWR